MLEGIQRVPLEAFQENSWKKYQEVLLQTPRATLVQKFWEELW